MHPFSKTIIEINQILAKMLANYDSVAFQPQKIGIYDKCRFYTSDGVAEYSDEYQNYAIMNSDELINDDIIDAANFLKIMVYNNFYQSSDPRLPNDLLALDYPVIYLNYDYLRYERNLLLKAFCTTDKYLRLNYFRMFLNVRDLRRQMIGDEFSLQEYRLETIEGLSQYVMCKALLKYDKKKYSKYLKFLMETFNQISKQYFTFRHANAFSGLMIALILDSMQFKVEELLVSNETLYQYTVRKISFYREPITIKSDKSLLENLKEFQNSLAEKFAIYFDNEPKKICGSWQIYQYDANRMYKDKGNIYHESFVVLRSLLDNSLLRLEGPVITKIMDNSIDIVIAYYQLGGKG